MLFVVHNNAMPITFLEFQLIDDASSAPPAQCRYAVHTQPID